MLPEEMQEVMAKVLFFVFALLFMCMIRVRALDAATLPQDSNRPTPVVSQLRS